MIIWAAIFALLGVISDRISANLRSDDQYLVDHVNDRLSEEIALAKQELDQFIDDYSTGTYLFDKSTHYKYPIYVFDNGKLKFWSDFVFVPAYESLSSLDSIDFIDLNDGKFVVQSSLIPYSNKQIEIFSLLAIYRQYPIDNKYLRSTFNEDIFPGTNYEVTAEGSTNPIIYNGKQLFSLASTPEHNWVPNYLKILTVIFFFISFLLAIYQTLSFGNSLVMKGRFVWGMLAVTLMIVFLRFLMIWSEFPEAKLDIAIFNPINFTSSVINPSLGDLLLNQISLLLIVLFALHSLRYSFRIKRWFVQQPVSMWTVLIAGFTIGSLMSGRYVYGTIKDILVNSQIQLDISSSIQFDSLRITVLVSFIIVSVLFFGVQFFTLKLLIRLYQKSILSLAIVLAISYAIFYIGYPGSFLLFLVTISVFWLISSQLKFIFNLGKRRYSAFLYFFLTASVVSIFASYAVYKQQIRDTDNEKRKFANNLLIERDILGEYLLSQVLPQIQGDGYILSRMYNERLADNTIEEKVNRNYIVDYFDKYQAKVHLFNGKGEPFSFNELQIPYDSVKKFLNQPGQSTDYPNIFYVRDPEVQDKYFAEVPMMSLNRPLGTILLELTLKKYVTSTVYPELLVENKYSGASNGNFDYAIYNGDKHLYKVGNFNYTRNFNTELFDQRNFYGDGIAYGDHHHLGVRTQTGNVIVITSSEYKLSRVLTNFSFFFFVMIMAVAVILILSNMFFVYPKAELNFSTKISFYLGFAFLVPLFIVSVAILNSLNTSYKDEINRSYEKRARRIEEHVNEDVTRFFNDEINRENLSSRLSRVSGLVKNDVNIYDATGILVASSQPRIYTSGLLSNYINPSAYFEINENERERIVLDESIGQLDYKTFYISIKSRESGDVVGILGMPFFESKNHLIRQQVEVLDNIINIFILILIVSLVISFFAMRILTEPLTLLTAKIKKTSLTDLNQPLEYNANDEIGLLVQEYNMMLKKLEESKKALAKSEKESAWKEIAKQVAHEIKNPLTPMKLTLQQMQRVIGVDDKSEKPIKNLLHQVDTLSDIATSFSTFAQMPIPEHQRFNINEELRHSIVLFENEKGNIDTDIETGDFYVIGDAKLTGRIFNNLLINALQAVPEDKKPEIHVRFKRLGVSKVQIQISDNGTGIPEELHNKIFIPNFSTKETGSGIGLAVAKRGIEHAGGDIWFETGDDGTTFFIELPIADN